ncbi:MAG TPA: hypothetical protein VFC87_01360 [Perlabentimonas sp.]|nr:hypothetical protein [Bacteroidales bacterium]MDD4672766.1 hypothetical protein [Bacteroidales bacterium]MDY0347784.1 hypothetical protein [Tenuifilaceae bacterium]HZJ73426.1 hypothetical protein [Perlabentimonas sp.]
MNKLFTPIIWNFQCFNNCKVDEIIDLHSIYKPLEIFQNLLVEIDKKAPEVTNETLKRIHERAS